MGPPWRNSNDYQPNRRPKAPLHQLWGPKREATRRHRPAGTLAHIGHNTET
jgi:hypothetical protein